MTELSSVFKIRYFLGDSVTIGSNYFELRNTFSDIVFACQTIPNPAKTIHGTSFRNSKCISNKYQI